MRPDSHLWISDSPAILPAETLVIHIWSMPTWEGKKVEIGSLEPWLPGSPALGRSWAWEKLITFWGGLGHRRGFWVNLWLFFLLSPSTVQWSAVSLMIFLHLFQAWMLPQIAKRANIAAWISFKWKKKLLGEKNISRFFRLFPWWSYCIFL